MKEISVVPNMPKTRDHLKLALTIGSGSVGVTLRLVATGSRGSTGDKEWRI